MAYNLAFFSIMSLVFKRMSFESRTRINDSFPSSSFLRLLSLLYFIFQFGSKCILLFSLLFFVNLDVRVFNKFYFTRLKNHFLAEEFSRNKRSNYAAVCNK